MCHHVYHLQQILHAYGKLTYEKLQNASKDVATGGCGGVNHPQL
jgi:hypothetical protein